MAHASDSSPSGEQASGVTSVAADVPGGEARATGWAPTGDKGAESLDIVLRLERALQRAPQAIAAIEGESGKSQQLLAQIEAGSAELERQQTTLKRYFTGLEQTCARAEEVQLGLTEFVGQLAEVGDNSQEKIALLMDSLEAGNKVQRELKEMAKQVSGLTTRLDTRTSDHAKRLNETADSYLAELRGTHESQLAELKRTFEEELAPFRGQGAHTLNLTELVERGVATINEETDRAERRLVEARETQASQITGLVERGIESIKETAHEQLGKSEGIIAGIRRETDRRKGTLVEAHESQVARLADLVKQGIDSIKTAGQEQVRELERRTTDGTGEADRRGRQLVETHEAQAARVADLVEKGIESISESGDQHLGELRELVERSRSTLGSGVVEHQDRLTKLAEGQTASLEEAGRTTIAELTREIEQQMSPFTAGGEHAQHLEQVVERGFSSIADAESQAAGRLKDQVQGQTAQFHEAADAKMQQLASQLQASRESVRMLSDSTREGQQVLGSLIDQEKSVESQIRRVEERVHDAEAATVRLDNSEAKAGPTVTVLKECLEGSEAAIGKIEQLIQDVWTLSTTAQERALQISERTEEATRLMEDVRTAGEDMRAAQQQSSTFVTSLTEANGDAHRQSEELSTVTKQAQMIIERVNASVVNASGVSERVVCETDSAGELVCDLGMLVERAEKTMEQIDTVCDSASAQAAEAVRQLEQADSSRTALGTSVERAEGVVSHVAGALERAEAAADRVSSASESARETVVELENCGTGQRALADQLQSHLQTGLAMTKDLSERITAGSTLDERLTATAERANQINRDMDRLLTTLSEHQELLCSSERVVDDFIEQAEGLRIKWQHLETRADAFGHQLNSMLAAPTKIVADAKSQAGQLDGVCQAVRKVFAGLSQTSLQANRDIAKYGRVSREANDRLAKLSAETKRASQTLREWVDEAAHAQSRLSRSLAQVPAVGQTHPASALEDLGRVSCEALPGTLKPADSLRASIPRRRDELPRTADHPRLANEESQTSGGGPGDTPREPTRDLATLIRDAEQAANARP